MGDGGQAEGGGGRAEGDGRGGGAGGEERTMSKRVMSMRGVVLLPIAVAACTAGDAGKRDSGVSAGIVVTPAEFSSAKNYVGIRYDSLPSKFAFVSGSLIPIAP